MPNRVINKEYLTRQFKKFNETVFGGYKQTLIDDINTKVDIREGYDLSKNDFTDDYKLKLMGLYNYDDTPLWNQINENADAIITLLGDDTVENSIDYKVKTLTEKLVKDAPEKFDTLKEIADWINDHDGGVASMQKNIEDNAEAIANLQAELDEYSHLVPEDENIDFGGDEDFYQYEWVHVVENSVRFTGLGALTDNPDDYIVDLVASKQTFDGTVYNSDPLTTVLSNVEVLGYDVNIKRDLSANIVAIKISGLNAASSKYIVGNYNDYTTELHEWYEIVDDSVKFTGMGALTDNLNDYSVKLAYYREVCLADPIERISVKAYTLTEAENAGFNVEFTNSVDGSSRMTLVTISGVSMNSDTFTPGRVTKNYELKEWYYLNDSKLKFIGEGNYTDSKSDYAVSMSHYKNTDSAVAPGVVENRDYTLAEAEALGFEITFDNTVNLNTSTTTVKLSGVGANSTTYNTLKIEKNYTLHQWIAVTGESLKFTGTGDLTNNTDNYTLDMSLYREMISSQPAVVAESKAYTLTEAKNAGFNVEFSSLDNGSIKITTVSLEGISATSNVFKDTKSTKEYELHQWLHVTDTSVFSTANYTDGNYDNCTVSNIEKLIETNSSGESVRSIETKSYTLKQLKDLGIAVNVTSDVSPNGNNYNIVTTLKLSGISLTTPGYSEGTFSKTLTDTKTMVYAATPKTLGTGVKANTTVKYEGADGITTKL